VVRKKGDKDYSSREKQMMVSLINDYSLFGSTDDEMIDMLSVKLGKLNNEKISETLFYRLKKEAIKKRGESGEWLDYYSRFHFVEHYRRRIEELELVQKNLIKIFVIESEKKEDDIKKNKFLINQLAKTIAENSKTLAEFGMALPIIAKIKSMIPLDMSTTPTNNDKNITYNEKRLVNENEKDELISSRNAKSAIFPPMDNWNNDDDGNSSSEFSDNHDPNRVF